MLRSLQTTWASGSAIHGRASDDVILVPAQTCVSQPLLRARPATALTSEVKPLLSECVAGLQGPRRPHPGDLETWAMCYLWCLRRVPLLNFGPTAPLGQCLHNACTWTFAGLCDLGLCWDLRTKPPHPEPWHYGAADLGHMSGLSSETKTGDAGTQSQERPHQSHVTMGWPTLGVEAFLFHYHRKETFRPVP